MSPPKQLKVKTNEHRFYVEIVTDIGLFIVQIKQMDQTQALHLGFVFLKKMLFIAMFLFCLQR